MKRFITFTTVFFSLVFLPQFSDAIEPLSTAYLDSATLELYAPQILDELTEGTSHQNGKRTNRITKEYGYSFFKLAKGDRSFTPPPDFLVELANQACDALGHPRIEFTNFIISLYEKGYNVEPHVDVDVEKPLKGFHFGNRIYGVVIEADEQGHLYFIVHEGKGQPPLDGEPIYEVEEAPGLVFCIEGELRSAPYYHAVSPAANRRISLTFREVHFED
jgi:hypothetical protein